MDAELLRLLLLGAGVLLVIGIYAWDRYKRAGRTMASKLRTKVEPSFRSRPRADSDRPHRGRDAAETRDADLLFEDLDPDADRAFDEREVAAGIDEPMMVPGADTDGDLDFDFNPYDETDYLHPDPDLDDRTPRLILQIGIVAKGAPFTGEQLQKAAEKVELVSGDMSIYHRYDPQRDRQVLFSMASMVEPGQFPVEDMSGYSTPGLVLFTQLPGVRDGLAIYSDMLFTAERLATLLNADLEDESHSRLTKQSIEHTRSKIIEHRRELALVRSRK
jgi:cell division protein ZipA